MTPLVRDLYSDLCENHITLLGVNGKLAHRKSESFLFCVHFLFGGFVYFGKDGLIWRLSRTNWRASEDFVKKIVIVQLNNSMVGKIGYGGAMHTGSFEGSTPRITETLILLGSASMTIVVNLAAYTNFILNMQFQYSETTKALMIWRMSYRSSRRLSFV